MTSQDPATMPRHVAAEMLDVEPESSAAEARSAFLARLERCDFVPLPEWCAGVAILTESPRVGGLHDSGSLIDLSCRQAFRNEVDGFAGTYWSLDPSARNERWQSLRQRCGRDLALNKYLQHLAGGLHVGPSHFDALQGRAADLGSFIRETFPLRPFQRDARHRDWLAGLAGEMQQWHEAASQVKKLAPAVALLGASLIDQMDGTPCLPNRDQSVASDKSKAASKTNRDGPLARPSADEGRPARPAARLPKKLLWGITVCFVVAAIGLLGWALLPSEKAFSPAAPVPQETAQPAVPKFVEVFDPRTGKYKSVPDGVLPKRPSRGGR